MEAVHLASTGAAVLALAALLLILFIPHNNLIHRRKLKLPPGPKPWPIIGNLNLIGSLPHRSLHTLSRKYGPIMQLQFGSFPVVVASSVEITKAFLKTHDSNFSSRPKTAAGKYTTYNYSDMTWAPYGPYWRQARRLFLTELFSSKRMESYEYIRNEELSVFLRELHIHSIANKPVALKHHLSKLNLNLISSIVLGKKFTDESGYSQYRVTLEEFKEMMDELFLLNGVINLGDFIPWLNLLDLQGHVKRMKALSRRLDRFLENVLDEHNERRKGNNEFVARDMVDVLLQLADDPALDVKIERHGVKAFTQDLIAGGTDSSVVTVEWAMAELLKKPKIIKKATEELDRVIGRNRWVEEKDVVDLPYIDAIIKETFRLHAVATILPPVVSGADCTVAGYHIPQATILLVNVWTISRDPSIWDGPDEFFPERFIGRETDFKGRSMELLPFGAGRRICPGYNLGLKVIQSSLANLLHGFTWSLPENVKEDDLNMEEIYGLSTRKRIPLIAVAEPRLPAHLYTV